MRKMLQSFSSPRTSPEPRIPSRDLPARNQIEPERPAGVAPLERPDRIELRHREAEAHTERDTARADLLTRAAEDGRLLAAVPRDAAVAEERDLDRHRAVHSVL